MLSLSGGSQAGGFSVFSPSLALSHLTAKPAPHHSPLPKNASDPTRSIHHAQPTGSSKKKKIEPNGSCIP
jgi:hypothetical protein